VFQKFILPFLILQRRKLCNLQIGLEECLAWVYFVKQAITKLQNCRKTNRFVMLTSESNLQFFGIWLDNATFSVSRNFYNDFVCF